MAEFTILTPYPHTPIRTSYEQQGRIFDHDWSHYTCDRVVFQPAKMTVSELETMYDWAWETFYGASGKQVRMGKLFRRVIEREVEDGTLRRFQTRQRNVATPS
jgi:hypothetical protein